MRGLCFIVLVAAFVCSDASAQSRQQSKNRDNNSPSAQSAQPPAPDQRGTDQSPLTVKILPGQKTKEEAEKEERDRGEKSAIDRSVADDTRRLAEYTKWLAVFTLALFLGAIGQAALFFYQLRYMRQGMKDATIAANAARDGAAAASEQAKALVVAERPYIFLKITDPGVGVADNGEMNFVGKKLKFKFVNYGKTPALIDEVKEAYRVVEGIVDGPPPLDPMKDRGRLVPIGTVSVADAPHVASTNLFDKIEDAGAVKMMKRGAAKERRICFYGFVRYHDAFGNHYINGFLAIFNPAGTWLLRGGDEYNYSHTERPEDIPPHPGYAEPKRLHDAAS
jgi:hypothetical protein